MEKIKQRRYRGRGLAEDSRRVEQSGLTVPEFCRRRRDQRESSSLALRFGADSDRGVSVKAARPTR